MVKKFLALALLLCVSAVLIMPAAHAAEAPCAPRLAAEGGVVAGGFQTSSGDKGSFSLFSANADGGDLRPLGLFHGRLAGVALDADGALLALTRDGALSRCGDDVEQLARPDSRWNMIGLFRVDGAPLAFTNDNGRLHTVTLDGSGNWTQSANPVADVGERTRIDGMILNGKLHLMLVSFADDLSRGAVRHLVREQRENGTGTANGTDGAPAAEAIWNELPSLPVGDVAAFAALPAATPRDLFSGASPAPRPGVVTLRGDTLSFHVWRDSANSWTRLPVPDGFEDALRNAQFFTAAAPRAAAGEADAAWLLTGETGAFLTPAGNSPATAAARVGKGAAPDAAASGPSGWTGWSGLFTLVGLAALIVIYCRRSRALSRAFPGRAPDLFSRGAALAVDWLAVSLIMSGYHIANGDIHILARLLTLEEAESVFWANLAGLIAFTAIFEILFGRTPGKHFAGIRVRSAFGGRPAFLQLLLRNILRAVDMFPLPVGFPGLVGAVVTLFGKRRRRIGDLVAKTVVLRHAPLSGRDFLLASASPRRLELLGALRLSVRSEGMDVDETIPPGELPRDAVCRLSQAKAKAAGSRAKTGEIVIAADTIVVLDGKILGKPKSETEAKEMLASLSGRSHTVFTGVTVWDTATGQGVTEYEETEVEFRTLSDYEITRYAASGEPMDKAGGYGVQSGGHLIKQVRGSFTNVVGLPMEKFRVMLAALDS